MLIKKRFIVCIIVFVFMFGLNLVNAETEGCMNKNVSNFEENISLDDNYDDFSFNLEDNYVQNFNDSGFVLNASTFYDDVYHRGTDARPDKFKPLLNNGKVPTGTDIDVRNSNSAPVGEFSDAAKRLHKKAKMLG